MDYKASNTVLKKTWLLAFNQSNNIENKIAIFQESKIPRKQDFIFCNAFPAGLKSRFPGRWFFPEAARSPAVPCPCNPAMSVCWCKAVCTLHRPSGSVHRSIPGDSSLPRTPRFPAPCQGRKTAPAWFRNLSLSNPYAYFLELSLTWLSKNVSTSEAL